MTDFHKNTIELLERISPPPRLAPDWADALARAGETSPARTRRLGWRLAPVPLVAAAILLLVFAWPFGARGSVLEQALAAIGDAPVTHVVAATHLDAQHVELRTGIRTPAPGREEVWYEAHRGLLVTVTYRGQLVGTPTLVRPGASLSGTLHDELVGGFLRDYRSALRSGAFHVKGKAVLYGTPVYWLAHRTPLYVNGPTGTKPAFAVEEVAVSTRSFKPIFVQTRFRGRILPSTKIRILSIATVPERPSLFKRTVRSLPLLTTADTAPPTTVARAARMMKHQPLMPSKTLSGLRRNWVGEPTYYAYQKLSYNGYGDPQPLPGIELYYGGLDATGYPLRRGRYVSITEFAAANGAVRAEGLGRFPSNGSAVLEGHRLTLSVNGLYVIIDASDPHRAILAARTLVAKKP
jgi:hypothetical protein